MLPGQNSGFRAGFRPVSLRENLKIGPPAGRRADSEAYPIRLRPKSDPEARFPGQSHYCVTECTFHLQAREVPRPAFSFVEHRLLSDSLHRSVFLCFVYYFVLLLRATAMPPLRASIGCAPPRAKARYLSPAMAAIRIQRENMNKTLKALRKDLCKEPRAMVRSGCSLPGCGASHES